MLQPASIKNNSGFTLIELLVSLVIIAVGMFGVLECLNVSLQHNLRNELRNEAIKLGEKYMADFRGMNFDAIADSYPVTNVTRRVRGANKNYVVERSSQVLRTESAQSTSRQVTVVVKWAYRNMTSQNRVVSVVARP
ncbi:prepilin-type N-terminal cleavage/methylation domain-containing protein [Geomonas sp. Red69]|uniref:Prepilin-type N-terminal cleavage/methylation domain-containing protein n=1 Tax=Geomonas diazotrophica TaxID=2843197 RepID=A0ABX8JEL5_9BACT|nr:MULTISPECIES: prepilin-type N-terminal cleavage/methylation domain-containing protein [Geomonas]MBU5636146.1 prepilin-type N-terminal cleavage/methylation domain-containing protein [Geomonas diazotrophica]QWV96044.1 prepilin-type N-terminal cleavage/methylation domain-containing protein [Geomonas nitrogeniifigens]QXE85112.1 prepilin-type N-terminal cleavage/methylation domain-containing protein [Geomonas nitrogeniifigens]